MARKKKDEQEAKPLVDLPNNNYKTKSEVEQAVAQVGEEMRERDRLIADANNRIAEIQKEVEMAIHPFEARKNHIVAGIAHYVKKHREELFPDYPATKTCKLMTGAISLRNVPASVKTRASSKLFEKILAESGLLQLFNEWVARLSTVYLRVKLELNKDAILADPLNARNKIGVEINEESERLYVKPSGLESEADYDAQESLAA